MCGGVVWCGNEGVVYGGEGMCGGCGCVVGVGGGRKIENTVRAGIHKPKHLNQTLT